MGKNGAGKSTLLKLILGYNTPSEGNIMVPPGLKLGYLPQQMEHAKDKTVLQEALTAFDELIKFHKEVEFLNNEIISRTDYESKEYNNLIVQLNNLNDKISILEQEPIESQAEKVLLGLGFKREQLSRQTSTFSQGWNMRIELAKVLLKKPDVLLLDEPTNHLDIESIEWFEDYLKSFPGAILLISHDRKFLDNITKRTVEIMLGKIYDYKVPYTKYKELRAERMQQQMAAYENQQKLIEKTEEFIERFRYKATKSNQVQSRIKQLDKLDRIEVDIEDKSALSVKFHPAPRSGQMVFSTKNAVIGYGSKIILDGIDITIQRGEKIAFVGRNGEGKSTLVKCIQGEIPFDGSLRVGHNVQIGYFAQNQAQLLDGELTVFDTIDRVAKGDIRLKIRDILGAFMFGGEASDKKVKFLSGGERTRLAMIRLLLEPVNCLILDEPTNHLDMRSKDVLKAAIRDFDGTVIVVSHDREFLDGLVTKVYEFGGGKVREHLGGIYDYLQKRGGAIEGEAVKSLSPQSSPSSSNAPVAEAKASGGAADYAARKEQAKQQRKLQKRVEECEKRVAKIEAELKELEEWMATPSGAANQALFEQYAQLKNTLAEAEAEWEEAMMALEE